MFLRAITVGTAGLQLKTNLKWRLGPEDTLVLIAVPLAAGSQSIRWSSARSIRAAIVLVWWVARDSLFLWAGGRHGGGGGRGRRTSFATAPRALNCSSVHGDKRLNCLSSAGKPSMWKNSVCHCLLAQLAAWPASLHTRRENKGKYYCHSKSHRPRHRLLGPREVEGPRWWKSAHVGHVACFICPPLGPQSPWQSCSQLWVNSWAMRRSEQGVAHAWATAGGDNFPWILQFPGPTLEHRLFAGNL